MTIICLLDSWNGGVTMLNVFAGNNKIKFNSMKDLIISDEAHRRQAEISSRSTLGIEGRGRTYDISRPNSRSASRGKSQGRTGRHIKP